MKPLLLKIAGLNSFRQEQEVDFSQLCAGGVFGIFGPTGSGKSTVLDAITLALYGKVERAERGTQGIINQNEDKVYVQFSFAIGGQQYIAERIYKKANDGGVNQYSCRFMQETDAGLQVLAEKKKEMDELVKDIIGLTVEDFTKAVVLPQGKFQEFLKLKGTDRRSMLQRLFALEQYGEKLTKKIRFRLEEAKNAQDTVESRQAELGDASRQAVQDADNNLQKQKNLLQQLKEKDETNRKKYEELKEVLQWQAELEKAQTKEQELKLQEREFLAKESSLQLALKANNIKPFINIVNNEETNLANVLKKLTTLEQQLQALESEFKKAENQYNTWQAKYQAEGEQLKIKLAKLQEAKEIEIKCLELEAKRQELLNKYTKLNQNNISLEENLKKLESDREALQAKKKKLASEIAEKERLTSQQDQLEKQREAWLALEDINKRLAEINKELGMKEKQIKEIATSKELVAQEVNHLQNSLNVLEKSLTDLEKPLLTQEEINKGNSQVYELSNAINLIEQRQEEKGLKERELQELNLQYTKLKTSLEYQGNIFSQLDQEKANISNELQVLEEEYKANERANLASILSKELITDEPCPVCGSTNHPQPCRLEEIESLKSIQGEIANKKQSLQELELKINKSFAEKSKLEAQLDGIRTAKANAEGTLNDLVKKINELFQACHQDTQEEVVSVDILKAKREEKTRFFQKAQQQLNDYQQTKEKLNLEVNQLKERFSQENAKFVSLKTREEALQEEYAGIKTKANILQENQQEQTEKFQQIAAGMSGEEVLAQYTKVKEAVQHLNQLRQQEKTIAQRLDEIVDGLFKQKGQLDENKQGLEALINEGQACKNQIEEHKAQINKITNSLKVQEAILQVEKEIAQIDKGLKDSTKLLEEKREQRDKAATYFYSTQQEKQQIANRLTKAQEDLQAKLVEYQFVSPGQVEEAFRTEGEIAELTQAIDEYKEAWLITRKNLAFYQEKLKGRSITQEQWQQFEKTRTEITKLLEEKQEIVYKLEDRLETLQKNHRRWLELEKERQKWQKLRDKLGQLEKLFRGNTFVEFIAEEQLIQVALDASRRLGELTQYRYALEVDAEGGFMIRDDANGGLRRPVSSLSGGETFLTSLALALALSSQIQLRGKYPLEFFFLDEGFGTLDSHLLETVMNSLERLRMDKMTIGIISHVPELKSRISRKLVVEPAEKGGEGTKLAVELA